MEGGGTLGETAAKPLRDVPGNSQHTHVVDEAVNRDTWECAFHVKKEDGGHMLPAPCIFDGLGKEVEGVGGGASWASTKMVAREDIVVFTPGDDVIRHAAVQQAGEAIGENNRAPGAR